MKKVLLTLGLAAATLPAAAVTIDTFATSNAGLRWLDLSAHPRLSALGQSGVGLQGVDAFTLNPAGLAAELGGQLQLAHQLGLADTSTEHLGFAQPWGQTALGLSLAYQNNGEVENYSVNTGGGITANGVQRPNAYSVGLGAARSFWGLQTGVTAKFIAQNIDGAAGSGVGVDAGVQLPLGSAWRLGASVLNLGTDLPGVALPSSARVGAGWTGEAFNTPLTGSLDVSGGIRDSAIRVGGGLEAQVAKPLALRVGYRGGSSVVNNGLTAGLGAKVKGWELDYAFLMGQFAPIHHISLGLGWGKGATPEPTPEPTPVATPTPEIVAGVETKTNTAGETFIDVSSLLNFDNNKFDVKPEGLEALGKLADYLAQNAGKSIKIKAYTDNRGNEGDNNWLSQERASSVKKALLSKGVTESRILSAEGFGAKDPVADNSTEEGRAKNRRVEVVIVDTAPESAK